MGKDYDYEMPSDTKADVNDCGSDINTDYGGDLARGEGVDLNDDSGSYGYDYGYEADPNEGSASSPETAEVDYGANEYTDSFTGSEHDLGNQLENGGNLEKRDMAKAVDLPPPIPQYIQDVPAIYQEAPAMPSLQDQYPGLIYPDEDFGDHDMQAHMNSLNEARQTDEALNQEVPGEHRDPPEDMASIETDAPSEVADAPSEEADLPIEEAAPPVECAAPPMDAVSF